MQVQNTESHPRVHCVCKVCLYGADALYTDCKLHATCLPPRHRRLLTDEGALRLEPTARAAAIVLRSLRRAVALASSEQILAELDEGRWPSEASLLLRCARLAKAVAPTLDLPTGAEELVRDVILGLAPVLRPMSAGVIANPIDPRRPAPSLGLLTCDAIAGLLEWGQHNLPELLWRLRTAAYSSQ